MTTFSGFPPTLIHFLTQLSKNNNRDWFAKNKSRYETEVLEPALKFVAAFASPLEKISPMFSAESKRVGGSVMRVYRDTRFSKDKTPYKTNLGIHFRHQLGRDVHAPGFYIHIAPDESFLAAGIWRPPNAAVSKIREAIVSDPAAWRKAAHGAAFRKQFHLAGDSLKKAPRGFDPEDPAIDDVERKDFIGFKPLKRADVEHSRFIGHVSDVLRASRPLMRFLCHAIGVPF